MTTNLEKFGFGFYQRSHCQEHGISTEKVGRVLSDSREKYLIQSEGASLSASITGKLRFNAVCRLDLPAVGDWVSFSMADEQNAVIETVLPRKTVLQRSAVGKHDSQIIAANVDTAFVVMAADRDFNLNRVDRYLALILDGGIIPVVILNKSDLVTEDQLASLSAGLFRRHPAVEVIASSLVNGTGLDLIKTTVMAGRTFCLLGSSGVGKSSLVNYLAGSNLIHTSEISLVNGRGRHTTTSRHLHCLESGALLLDTPGMREVAMSDAGAGVEEVFGQIEELAQRCRFSDCSHRNEPGCAIVNAIESGELDASELKSYEKLRRESRRFEEKVVDQRRREKGFGRMVKEVLKVKKSLKGISR